MVKKRKNHFGMAKFSRYVLFKAADAIRRMINLPGDYGMNAPKETFAGAQDSLQRIDTEIALECYPRVADMSWAGIVIALQAKREYDALKDTERWVRDQFRILRESIQSVENKLVQADQLVARAEELYGESSTPVRWLSYCKPYVAQAVCARRSSLSLAEHCIGKGEWNEAKVRLLEVLAEEKRADDILALVKELIDNRFYGRAKLRPQHVQ